MLRQKNDKFEINKKSYKPGKNVNPNSFFSQSRDSIVNLHKEVFKQISELDKQGNDAYVVMNEKRFKHLLLSKEYVDTRYIALQIYLLQENIGSFKYDEIAQNLKTFVDFIEDTLLKGRSISFNDIFYLSGSPVDKLLVNKTRVPRVAVTRRKPKGIVLKLKDLKINLDGTREFALHELIIKNFNNILLNLLKTKGQVLVGNLLILQLKTDYAIVVSERFLVGVDDQHSQTIPTSPETQETADVNLTQPMPLENLKESKKSNNKLVPKSRLGSILYKTEQIFLHRKNRIFQANRRFKMRKTKQKTKKALLPFQKTQENILKDALVEEEKSRKLDTYTLKKEIKNANKLIGFFQFKKKKKPKQNN